jgi:energy-coupling factor transport system substrate-specific component
MGFMKNTAKQRLVGKDFVNIGVYTILLMVVTFIVSIPFAPFMSVTYPFMAGICALFSAPIFMLMTYKVAKHGTILLCTTVFGFIYTFMGHFYLLPMAFLAGILCEVVMWKQGTYRSFWHNVASFSIVSVLMFACATYIPIYIFGPEYYMNLASSNSEYALIQIQFAMSPLWASVTVVTAVFLAVVGCLIGRRLLKKHFMKAGLVSKE